MWDLSRGPWSIVGVPNLPFLFAASEREFMAGTETKVTPSSCESLERAYQVWVKQYLGNTGSLTDLVFTARGKANFAVNTIAGAATLATLFPETLRVIPRYHPMFSSASSAWLNDWYKVGSDLYWAMRNLRSADSQSVRESTKNAAGTTASAR